MVTCPTCANESSNNRFCDVCGATFPYVPPPPRARPAPLPDDLTNVQLERFKLAHSLGEDAISDYYAARHVRADIDAQLIVRVLKREAAADGATMTKFVDDAKRLARATTIEQRMQICDFTTVSADDRRAIMVLGISDDAPVTLAELLAYTA